MGERGESGYGDVLKKAGTSRAQVAGGLGWLIHCTRKALLASQQRPPFSAGPWTGTDGQDNMTVAVAALAELGEAAAQEPVSCTAPERGSLAKS